MSNVTLHFTINLPLVLYLVFLALFTFFCVLKAIEIYYKHKTINPIDKGNRSC